MPRTVPLLIAALLALGVLLSGCAPAAQQAGQQATGVQVDKGGNQVTVKGSDGQSLTVDSSLPDELTSFKVPSGFKSEGGGTMSSGGDKLAAASWKGNGDAQTVIDFFKGSLPGQGWTEEGTFVSGDGGMLNYSRSDGTGLTVTVTKEDDNSITIAVLSGKSSKTPTPKSQDSPAKASAATPTPEDEEEPTPEPTWTPAAPKTGDASALPAELQGLPLPSGFAPIKDKSVRMASGGNFAMAATEFYGPASVKDASSYFSTNLPNKGWNVDIEQVGESESTFVATSETDDSLHLSINVSEEEAGGSRIYMQVTKG